MRRAQAALIEIFVIIRQVFEMGCRISNNCCILWRLIYFVFGLYLAYSVFPLFDQLFELFLVVNMNVDLNLVDKSINLDLLCDCLPNMVGFINAHFLWIVHLI